jgi:hypothetical protein
VIEGIVGACVGTKCHDFAFPSGTGLLPGNPPATAVSTRLMIFKGLHVGSNPAAKPWITARLHYVNAAGVCVGVVGTCHLREDGSETLDSGGYVSLMSTTRHQAVPPLGIKLYHHSASSCTTTRH